MNFIRTIGRSQKANAATASAGERAMAVAMLYPDGGNGGGGKKGNPADSVEFSQRRIREARQVLRYSQELGEKVRDGMLSARAGNSLANELIRPSSLLAGMTKFRHQIAKFRPIPAFMTDFTIRNKVESGQFALAK